MVGNKHMCIAQHARATSDNTGPQQRLTQSELYRIPTELIQDIFNHIKTYSIYIAKISRFPPNLASLGDMK